VAAAEGYLEARAFPAAEPKLDGRNRPILFWLLGPSNSRFRHFAPKELKGAPEWASAQAAHAQTRRPPRDLAAG
jgi:hypothetical protein